MNEDRQKIWDEYQGPKNGPMRRMFLDYNRYFEAQAIASHAQDIIKEHFSTLTVLDYGCGVADYGIYFARLGSFVCLYDIDKEALNFAIHRFELENLTTRKCDLTDEHDLVIFGEVLDHLDDPLNVVKSYVEGGTKFFFTSSYPYRSDDPNDAHWKHDHHPAAARMQQAEIRSLLEENYNKVNFGGQRNLWTKKI